MQADNSPMGFPKAVEVVGDAEPLGKVKDGGRWVICTFPEHNLGLSKMASSIFRQSSIYALSICK